MQRPSPGLQSSRPRGLLLRVGVLALILAVALFATYRFGWLDTRHTLEHVTRLRQSHSFPVFAATFVVASGIGMAIGLPGLPFVAAAGALFGTLLGSALGWAASMVGSIVGYWIARTIGHDVVLRWVHRFPRVDTAVTEGRDFGGMLRLRLIPVLPIGVVNFVAGLARAPLDTYIAATAIGIIPATVIYAYFADSLLEGVGNGRREAWKSLIVASTLLLVLSLTPAFARWLKGRETRGRKPRVVPHPHPQRRL